MSTTHTGQYVACAGTRVLRVACYCPSHSYIKSFGQGYQKAHCCSHIIFLPFRLLFKCQEHKQCELSGVTPASQRWVDEVLKWPPLASNITVVMFLFIHNTCYGIDLSLQIPDTLRIYRWPGYFFHNWLPNQYWQGEATWRIKPGRKHYQFELRVC